jgi:hypothetical protein
MKPESVVDMELGLTVNNHHIDSIAYMSRPAVTAGIELAQAPEIDVDILPESKGMSAVAADVGLDRRTGIEHEIVADTALGVYWKTEVLLLFASYCVQPWVARKRVHFPQIALVELGGRRYTPSPAARTRSRFVPIGLVEVEVEVEVERQSAAGCSSVS